MEYTNEPRALREELVEGSVVVRKTRVEVARGVICRWRVVWGERGSGMERWWGWRVGVIVDGVEGDCWTRLGWEGVSIIKGISTIKSGRELRLHSKGGRLPICDP